jgi:hypothetical protein
VNPPLIVTLIVGALALATCTAPAHAAQCAPRASVVETLTGQYAETRRSIGLDANNLVVETWASTSNGTWSWTITLPDGQTCLLASGTGFEAFIVADVEGDPA